MRRQNGMAKEKKTLLLRGAAGFWGKKLVKAGKKGP